MDEVRIPPSGDPFTSYDHDREHPHACIDGWVYLGRLVESQEDLDSEVVEYEAVRCKRCEQERREMSEERMVPAYYPDFADAVRWRSWDGSLEAETWTHALSVRDQVIVDTAALFRKAGGPGTDIGGLTAELWRMIGEEEIIRVLRDRQEEIERKAGAS